MWLNNFPVAGGISDRFSPREIILRHSLDAKRHCRAPFGAYCETHKDNTPTNSMKTRGMPSICLGPCCKPSDQPRDAARREECSNRMKRV
jgi:hypothetical protein